MKEMYALVALIAEIKVGESSVLDAISNVMVPTMALSVSQLDRVPVAVAVAVADELLDTAADADANAVIAALSIAVKLCDEELEGEGKALILGGLVAMSVHMQLHCAVKDAVRLDESDEDCETVTVKDPQLLVEGDCDTVAVMETEAELFTDAEDVIVIDCVDEPVKNDVKGNGGGGGEGGGRR